MLTSPSNNGSPMNDNPGTSPSITRTLRASIFLSPSEPRLRAGWRLLTPTLRLIIFDIGLTAPHVLYAYSHPIGLSCLPYFFAATVLDLIAFTASIFLARKFLDRRPFSSLGFKLSWQAGFDYLPGLAIAGLIMGTIFSSMLALG